MPFHSTNLFFEDLVPETGLEFTLTQGCSCNAHGFLATAQQYLLRVIEKSYYILKELLHMAYLAIEQRY